MEINDLTLPISDELNSLFNFLEKDMSQDLPTLTIDVDYFLLGILIHKNNDVYRILDACLMSSSIEVIGNAWYDVVASKALSAVKPNRKIMFDNGMREVLKKANEEAVSMKSPVIASEHVFLVLLKDTSDSNKIGKVFSKSGLTYDMFKSKINDINNKTEVKTIQVQLPDGSMGEMQVIQAANSAEAEKMVKKILSQQNITENIPGMPKKKSEKNAYINEYCTNLNDMALKGKITPLVGRGREIGEIIRIIGRKKKNNAILLGGEGVGKTAIAEAIALKIVENDVPDFLLNKVLVSLDMTALMAGTTLRGMFEERVQGLLSDIRNDSKFILFIDNIGAILADKSKNDMEISTMISRSLENGDIQIIGTSDFASYRRTFDKDPSLARRFQKIIVEAPDQSESENILFGIKGMYEDFHHVKYSDEAVKACITLADRYINERNLPDSAIDLLDEAGSMYGTTKESDEMITIRKDISSKKSESEELKRNNKYDEADKVESDIVALTKKYNSVKRNYEKSKKENPFVIGSDEILGIVSVKTGIPVKNLSSDDKKKLVGMNERIKQSIIGQDSAVDTVCKALKRNRIGLHKHGCMYSAMMIGGSGVGKTKLAKELAKELFGNEKALVRFDMSEFSDKVSVNKLIGSNPGYVGYEEGGQLTEKIKNKKYCVLLLDEIEKADPEVYNIFLQVLDEGFLTDNSGMRVDFSNVIIMFTSNVGSKTASEFGRNIGFKDETEENIQRILKKSLKDRFPPEFINRVDDIIYFNKLTEDNLKSIIRIEMDKFNTNLKELGFSCTYGDDVVDYIYSIVEGESEYGARPIIRAIQDTVENVVTDSMLEKKHKKGHVFELIVNEENKLDLKEKKAE